MDNKPSPHSQIITEPPSLPSPPSSLHTTSLHLAFISLKHHLLLVEVGDKHRESFVCGPILMSYLLRQLEGEEKDVDRRREKVVEEEEKVVEEEEKVVEEEEKVVEEKKKDVERRRRRW